MISLYSCKIVDKKEILRSVSNAGIYCSSDKFGTVYPVQYIFENSTVNIKVDCVWNMMAHAQKPEFVFRRNGRVHLNLQRRQFSRLLAAEVCASAVVMLDTPSSEVVKGTGYPLHSSFSSSPPLPCVTVCHHVSTELYLATRMKTWRVARLGAPWRSFMRAITSIMWSSSSSRISTFILYTSLLIQLHKEKSNRITSGDLGGPIRSTD